MRYAHSWPLPRHDINHRPLEFIALADGNLCRDAHGRRNWWQPRNVGHDDQCCIASNRLSNPTVEALLRPAGLLEHPVLARRLRVSEAQRRIQVDLG